MERRRSTRKRYLPRRFSAEVFKKKPKYLKRVVRTPESSENEESRTPSDFSPTPTPSDFTPTPTPSDFSPTPTPSDFSPSEEEQQQAPPSPGIDFELSSPEQGSPEPIFAPLNALTYIWDSAYELAGNVLSINATADARNLPNLYDVVEGEEAESDEYLTWATSLAQWTVDMLLKYDVSENAPNIATKFMIIDDQQQAHYLGAGIQWKTPNDNRWDDNDVVIANYLQMIVDRLVRAKNDDGIRAAGSSYDNKLPAHVSNIRMMILATGWNVGVPAVGCSKLNLEKRMWGELWCISPKVPKFPNNSCVFACIQKRIELWGVLKKIDVDMDSNPFRDIHKCMVDFQKDMLFKKFIMWDYNFQLFKKDYLPHLCAFFKLVIWVYAANGDVINKFGNPLDSPFCVIKLHFAEDNHCWIVLTARKCLLCGARHKSAEDCKKCPICLVRYTKDEHTCSIPKLANMIAYRDKKEKWANSVLNTQLLTAKSIYEKKYEPRIVIAFDCESFFDNKGNHHVYVIGAKCGILAQEYNAYGPESSDLRNLELSDTEYCEFWGKECIKEFFDWTMLVSQKYGKKLTELRKEAYRSSSEKAKRKRNQWKTYVIAFNGSRYDFILTMRTMVTHAQAYKLKNVMMSSNELMTFEYGNKIYVRDLLRLMAPMSLEAAAKAFGLDKTLGLAKGEFPHLWLGEQEDAWNIVNNNFIGPHPEKRHYFKVKDYPNPVPESWNFKEDCAKYLKSDVDILMELTRVLTSSTYEHLWINLLDKITAPQMAAEFWASLVAPFGVKKDIRQEFPGLNEDQYAQLQRNLSATQNFHPFPELVDHKEIYIIKDEEIEKNMREAIYGGLVYPTKFEFVSQQYDLVKDNLIAFDEIEDFQVAVDFSGLYAHAMKKKNYPHGKEEPIHSDEAVIQKALDELADISDPDKVPMFIAYVHRTCPKMLAIPVLPLREKTALKWNVKDGCGMYASPDLWLASRRGYLFKPAKVNDEEFFMIRWPRKSKIFENAMIKGSELREIGERENNEAINVNGKLIQNSTYGKMGEKPIYTTVQFIEGNDAGQKVEKFFEENLVDSWFPMFGDAEDSEMVGIGMCGTVKDKQAQIKKPVQLAAFILSWARYIMQVEGDRLDSNAYSNPIESIRNTCLVYRDTDSIVMNMNQARFEWLQREVLPAKKELGKMFWDLKGGVTKIIRAIYLAPKTYMFEYIVRDPNDQFKYKFLYKFRAKGMPAEFLTLELFECMLKAIKGRLMQLTPEERADENAKVEILDEHRKLGEKHLKTIKKILTKMNGKEEEASRLYSSCYNMITTRCMIRNVYWGREAYLDNETNQFLLLPWGYDKSILIPKQNYSLCIPGGYWPVFQPVWNPERFILQQNPSLQYLESGEELPLHQVFVDYESDEDQVLLAVGAFLNDSLEPTLPDLRAPEILTMESDNDAPLLARSKSPHQFLETIEDLQFF